MNNRQDFSDIGERIQRAMKDAVETRDFGQINSVVTDTINAAVDEVRWQVENVRSNIENNTQNSRYSSNQQRVYSRIPAAGKRQTAPAVKKQSVRIVRKGKVGGILKTVFGSIGLGIFSILSIVHLIWWAFVQDPGIAVSFAVFAVLGVGSLVMLSRGLGVQAKLRRAERYAMLGREKMYIEMQELAHRTGKSLRKIKADVRSMIHSGIFPEGHLDKEEKYLLLSDESWKQYQAAQLALEEQNRREAQNRQKTQEHQDTQVQQGAKAQQGVQAQQDAQSQQDAAVQLVTEGQDFMDRLRGLNDEIPGEVISNKLFYLDLLLQRVFAVLKEHPEKAPQMKKFMEYYLPATVRLVETYAEFDRAGVNGENIVSAKAEIEKTMDTINHAFEKLLNDLFQNAAFEAEADAQVLKTMLAQDGYAKNDFGT